MEFGDEGQSLNRLQAAVVGPAEHCAEVLAGYADAGCQRVYIWPLGDEPRQFELVASAVRPT